jgi:hypothetical protein
MGRGLEWTIFLAMSFATTSSFGADGTIADWGPFRFGMTVEQIRSIRQDVKAPAPDPSDSELSTVDVSGIKLRNVNGTLTARLYKNRAFEFSFLSVTALDAVLPNSVQNLPPKTKVAEYCPVVFDTALDLMSASYGRADEILRPGDALRLDTTQTKFYRATWWMPDGSRVRIVSNQTTEFCSEFISVRSSRYAKTYVPEVVAGAK